MSEATGKALLALLFLAALLGAGFNIGESRGENRMKRWQDQWYAAHPVVKEVPTTPTINGASVYIVKPGEKCAVISFDQIHYNVDCEPPQPKPQKGSLCRDNEGGFYIIGNPNTPSACSPVISPKPQKGSKRLPTLDESFRSMNKNLNEIDATIDRLGADFGLRWSKRQQTWVPIPEKEPAPLSKCDCKDYGMGLICTCPAEADLIHFSGTAGVPAEKPQ